MRRSSSTPLLSGPSLHSFQLPTELTLLLVRKAALRELHSWVSPSPVLGQCDIATVATAVQTAMVELTHIRPPLRHKSVINPDAERIYSHESRPERSTTHVGPTVRPVRTEVGKYTFPKRSVSDFTTQNVRTGERHESSTPRLLGWADSSNKWSSQGFMEKKLRLPLTLPNSHLRNITRCSRQTTTRTKPASRSS
jgi:hypothetical protein